MSRSDYQDSLREEVERWVSTTSGDITVLADVAAVSLSKMALFRQGLTDLANESAEELRKALRGRKVWQSPLSEEEIARRRDEAEDRRKAYVEKLLHEEQEKYKLHRRGRPLSSMAI